MRRRIFTFVSLISLVAFIATLVLWVRSYQATDQLDFHYDGGHWRVASVDANFRVDNEPQRAAQLKLVAEWRARYDATSAPYQRQMEEIRERVRHSTPGSVESRSIFKEEMS